MRMIEERVGKVLVLTIDYPERRNALALGLREQLADILDRAEGDKDTRAIVLTGSNGTFCSGGDISGMDVTSGTAGRERLRRVHRVIRFLVAGKTPVVAAIEGWCVGAGMSLACACDTVVASEDARFMAGFAKVGLMADLGLPFTLPARVGVGRAKQILFYNEQINAQQAERIGLVDVLAAPGKALDVALEKARFLSEQAPYPIAMTKEFMAKGLDEALETEKNYQTMLFLSADHQEGKAAFMGKRNPVFEGG